MTLMGSTGRAAWRRGNRGKLHGGCGCGGAATTGSGARLGVSLTPWPPGSLVRGEKKRSRTAAKAASAPPAPANLGARPLRQPWHRHGWCPRATRLPGGADARRRPRAGGRRPELLLCGGPALPTTTRGGGSDQVPHNAGAHSQGHQGSGGGAAPAYVVRAPLLPFALGADWASACCQTTAPPPRRRTATPLRLARQRRRGEAARHAAVGAPAVGAARPRVCGCSHSCTHHDAALTCLLLVLVPHCALGVVLPPQSSGAADMVRHCARCLVSQEQRGGLAKGATHARCLHASPLSRRRATHGRCARPHVDDTPNRRTVSQVGWGSDVTTHTNRASCHAQLPSPPANPCLMTAAAAAVAAAASLPPAPLEDQESHPARRC